MDENSGARILVVEDEEPIRRFIYLNLTRSGFQVFEASTGEEALGRVKGTMPDLVVLDIMLPGMDGFSVCRGIKGIYPNMPIIMLTARGQDVDKIMGLELGADDYMVKPFNPLELGARIRAVLRRSGRFTMPETITSGRITIDLKAQKLYKDGRDIELTPREFSLMKVFMENPCIALSRDDLLNLVWGRDYLGDPKTVDVHVRRLREKIEDDPSNPEIIQAVWGFGYRCQEVR
jgi:DNA-binding response OmpR family regulator